MNTTTLRGLRTACRYQRIQSGISPRISSYSSRSPSIQSTTFLLFRYASTTTTSSNKETTSSKQHPVNGPLTTLPAPLQTPTRQPSQSLPGYLFALGKSYVAFYKTGIKNIYTNYKASQPLQSTIDKNHSSSLAAAVKAGSLTRSEFQLLARNWHDVKRVPMFALVLLVCGEFTPLVVIALTSIVPWTCRIPKQIQSDRAKLEERRRISFRNLTAKFPEKGGIEALNRMQLLHISWSLGLSSSAWDYLGGQLPGLPTGVLRRKVKRRVEYLEMDDRLIGRAGGVKDMDVEEVRMALVERGLDVLGRQEKGLKGDLNAWLKSREKVSVESLLLTRPSAWPVKVSDVKVKL
ncbi:hypothetical protein IFR04_005451 [Cadophora malorum]|uniref:Letm1 RBD domain-containing protein n=1 Tax=Cadophora malorum TaxID=108018 RepID=A0A8H7W9Z2_9HELO|nr:hypothetical protein IFR04_005451 [Cadophora malorum]